MTTAPRFLPLLAILATSALTMYAPDAFARDQIHIAGSSTVFPFTSMAAEQFGKEGKFKTPIVESTGTGGGFKLFCEGVGEDKLDINDASRPITDSEKELCTKNGVTDIAEVTIGYDGIILANKKGGPTFSVSKKDLFMALARWLPDKSGKLVLNTIHNWNEIDPKLPNEAIEVYGPPPTSGTRDAFAELVMEKGCAAFPEFTRDYPDEKDRKKVCHTLREDGPYVDAGEDDNVIIQKLVSNEKALGIFGYSYYDNSRAKIQAATVEGVAPEAATVETGKYSISRSLFLYVKKQHIGLVPGLVEFLQSYTSSSAIGKDGYMIAKGLIPLKEETLKASQAVTKGLSTKK